MCIRDRFNGGSTGFLPRARCDQPDLISALFSAGGEVESLEARRPFGKRTAESGVPAKADTPARRRADNP